MAIQSGRQPLKRRARHNKSQRPTKRARKANVDYHSSSSSDEADDFDIEQSGRTLSAIAIENEAEPEQENAGQEERQEQEEEQEVDQDEDASEEDSAATDEDLDSDMDDDEQPSSTKPRKRNDPSAFAESMSKILASKLTTSRRSDPVLSRSAAASAASKELTDSKLEARARRKIHAEKRMALERGRVKDVLGLESTDTSTAAILEEEKRLKKTAQRGVIKLFNAVRAAQVKGDMAREAARKEGIVGMAQREERVSEMTKKGFLDFIASGGKKQDEAKV